MSRCGIRPCAHAARWPMVARVWPAGMKRKEYLKVPPEWVCGWFSVPQLLEPMIDARTFETLTVCDFHRAHMPDTPAGYYALKENQPVREWFDRVWVQRGWTPIDWSLSEWDVQPVFLAGPGP